MNILGIETSCDETSLAIVGKGKKIRAHTIFSQSSIHAPYAGVVPELASRAHVQVLLTLYKNLNKKHSFNAIAATQGPGLKGSLMVGMSFAKSISYACNFPFYAIDHIKAHVYAIQLEKEIAYPYMVLVVSGGHTLLAVAQSPLTLEVISGSIDDACGEAFDKVADFLGLSYPGGPAIEKLARTGDPYAYCFPSPWLRNHTFSYSGLKTAVVLQNHRFLAKGARESAQNIAASFQYAALSAVVNASFYEIQKKKFHTLVVCGGVAANEYLRYLFMSRNKHNIAIEFPSQELCTDNAAMIAGLAYWYAEGNLQASFDASVYSREYNYLKHKFHQ